MRIFVLRQKYYVKHSEFGPCCTTVFANGERISLKIGLTMLPEKFLY
jgi:hypothetical protein